VVDNPITTGRRKNMADDRKGQAFRIAVGIMALLLLMAGGAGATLTDSGTWQVTKNGMILEIAYGSSTNFPQYAALHTDSSYFRMVAPDTNWGTSVILLPSFWENGTYHQGAPVTYEWYIEGNAIVFLLHGNISNLSAKIKVRITPPSGNNVTASVKANVTGDAKLDARVGEAFKIVMLSSMNIASDLWDAHSAYAGSTEFSIPEEGWIVLPPVNVSTSVFGLKGGDSKWKTNAPTVEIRLDKNHEVTGWVTKSNNPNDDNVGFWAATNDIIRTWNYTISVRKELTANVSIPGFSFQPQNINVSAGTTVTWTNLDSTSHTVTSDTGLFDSGSLSNGQTFSRTFNTAGNYDYHCSIHSFMTGRVVVSSNGDVNRNGKLDTGDATLMLRYVVDLPIPAEYLPILPTGDMNCNGIIDTGDATLVLRDIVGLDIPRCWE